MSPPAILPRSIERLISWLAPVFVVSFPSLAAAQVLEDHRLPANVDQGMDTHLFRPAVDSKGFFSVNGSDILGSGDISFGLVMDYGHNLMRLEPGHGADALITHSFQGTFDFNYGIANQAVVVITIPVNLEGGDSVLAPAPGALSPPS